MMTTLKLSLVALVVFLASWTLTNVCANPVPCITRCQMKFVFRNTNNATCKEFDETGDCFHCVNGRCIDPGPLQRKDCVSTDEEITYTISNVNACTAVCINPPPISEATFTESPDWTALVTGLRWVCVDPPPPEDDDGGGGPE